MAKKGQSPKLIRPWTGPWIVKKKLNDVTYRIQKLDDKSRTRRVVHFNRLKLITRDALVSIQMEDEHRSNPQKQQDAAHGVHPEDNTSQYHGGDLSVEIDLEHRM